MRPVVITKQLATAAANNISLSQSPGAGAILLNGSKVTAGVATLDTQRQVRITSGGNDSGITFTVFGTDQSGVAISEAVTGSNGSTADTTMNFYTITSVTHTASVAGTITVGTNGVGATLPIVLDQHVSPFAVALYIEIASTATVNVTVQYTPDDVFSLTNVQTATGLKWTSHASLTSKSASTDSNIAFPAAAVRLLVNSGTDAATFIVRQAGLYG